MAQRIRNAAISNQKILTNFTENTFNGSFNSNDLILLTNITKGLTMYHVCNTENEFDHQDPTVRKHLNSLERNLAGFHREADLIPRDGECVFRSIA